MLFTGKRQREFVERQRHFVQVEFEAQRQQHREARALPLHERVERGTCLRGLSFDKIDQNGCACFSHEGNDSRLREGDRVTLHPAHGEDRAIAASIFREEHQQIWLAKDSPFQLKELRPWDECEWLIDEDFIDLESIYLAALDRLCESEIGQTRILPLLSGEIEPTLDPELYDGAYDELDTKPSLGWEEEQKEAIASCLAAQHYYLVQGPPGTGKTRTLAEVVRQLVERGERVLVTGPTHRAIHNALEGVAHRVCDHERVVHFGEPVHRRGEPYAFHEYFEKSPLFDLQGGWVAGATPFALRKRLQGVEFDTILIDEAGQMTTPVAIMAMLSGRKYLFFGDQKQLGPVVVSHSRRNLGDADFFKALHGLDENHTMLNVSFRLNDQLVTWPSESFYWGDLVSSPSSANRRLAWQRPSEISQDVAEALDPEQSLVWIPTRDGDSAFLENLEETAIAVRLLRALQRGGIPYESIAVVTPYRRQARLIRNQLELLDRSGTARDCVIDTVERMQGQEREVVLLSLCASDPAWILRQAEFLFDPRRLNVSATRARSKLIILASESLLTTDLGDTDLREDQELLQRLLRESHRINLNR